MASPSGKATVKGTASAAFTVKLPGPSKMKWEADAKLCVNLMGARQAYTATHLPGATRSRACGEAEGGLHCCLCR